jgi:predicted transposase YbfD/YdcC
MKPICEFHGGVDVAKPKRVELLEIVGHFQSLEDPRSSINRHHPLVSVMVISLMAVLSGADGPTAIRKWAESKRDLLLSVLDLPKGLPSKDVFRRVLMALDPQAFQTCFVSWLNSMQSAAGSQPGQRPTMAVDGKCLRGSHDRSKGLGPLHLVSVWLTDVGLTLAQTATDQKSNEITAIPEVLKLVDMTGAIISIDAMGTQTAIAAQIVDGGGDYVLALKANQGGLHDAVIEHVNDHVDDDFARLRIRQHIETDDKHGRDETRTYIQFLVPKDLKGQSRWKGLQTIGLVISHSVCGEKETMDVRYYISSLRMGIKQFARSVRSHWSIENTCHWSLDMTYREDAQRTRNRQLAENLAWLRRFTLSLIKQHPGKESLVMKRRMCGWNDDFLMQVITGQTI